MCYSRGLSRRGFRITAHSQTPNLLDEAHRVGFRVIADLVLTTLPISTLGFKRRDISRGPCALLRWSDVIKIGKARIIFIDQSVH